MNLEKYYKEPIKKGDIVVTSMFSGVLSAQINPHGPGIFIGVITDVHYNQEVSIKVLNEKTTSRNYGYIISRPLKEVIKAPPELLI